MAGQSDETKPAGPFLLAQIFPGPARRRNRIPLFRGLDIVQRGDVDIICLQIVQQRSEFKGRLPARARLKLDRQDYVPALGAEPLDRLAQTIRMTAPVQIVDTPLERPIHILGTETATAAGGQTEPAYLPHTRSDHRSPPHEPTIIPVFSLQSVTIAVSPCRTSPVFFSSA